MASVRTDKVQLQLDVKADQAKTELDNMLRKEKLITDELKNMRRGTEEYINKNKELKEVHSRMGELRKELGLTGMSLNQLERLSKELNRDLKGLVPGTEAFINKSKEIAQVKARTDEVKKSVNDIASELDKSGNGFLSFVKKSAAFTGVYLGIEAAIGALKQLGSESINSAAKTSDSLADIQKSTGLTKAEVSALNDQFKEIDTRTLQSDLQQIAVVGGQIGVAGDEIEGFTESVDKAVVALGDEFTGGAEEVAKKMGTLQKLFVETRDLDAGTAINKIGSALNALGASGTATGPVVAEFTTRIGQLGNLAPEISQTLGLGAAFQELGLSAEISSGGLSNILLTAAKDTAGFATQLGLTKGQFENLINSDPNEVILKLAESFKGASQTEIIQTMDSLGIKSQESTKVLSLLADKTDFVREKQSLASVEMEKATSLTDEFNIKNTTLAAEIEKSDKQLADMKDEIGQGLAPAYIKIIGLLGVFLDIIMGIPKFISQNKVALSLLVAGVIAWNFEQVKANALALKDVAMKQLQASWAFRTAIAQQGLNAAMRANPIGAVITVVALLVLGFTQLYERSQTFRAGLSGLYNAIKEFISIAGDIALFLINPLKNAGKLAELKNAGQRLGTAFSDGYNKKIAEETAKSNEEQKKKREKQTQEELKEGESKAKALTAIQKKQIEQYRRLVDESRGFDTALDDKELKKLKQAVTAEQNKNAEKAKQLREKEEEEQKKAARNIHDYKLSLIVDEFDRKIEQLKTNAAREKEEVKGLAQQIAEQRRLIDLKLDQDIKAVEVARSSERLKLAKETAEKETEIRRQSLLKEAELDVLYASRKDITGNVSNEGALLAAKLRQLDVQKKIELAKAEETAREKLAQDIRNLQLSGEAKTNYEMQALVAMNNEKLLIEENFQQQRNELNRNYVDQARQEEVAKTSQALEQSQQFIQAFFDFKKIANDKELTQAEKDMKSRLKNLDSEYKAGRISKDQYEKQKSEIESNYDDKTRKLKRQAAKDEKAQNIANSIMAGVLAVLKASQNPLGFLSPTAIATAAFAALATAKIVATPVPEFRDGGLFRGIKRKFASGGTINSTGGIADVGQSHDNGGIKMLDGATGEYLGEWEKGESYMILSRHTTSNNRDIIEQLLDSSLNRNGARIKMSKGGIYAADGAVVGTMPGGASGSAAQNDLIPVLINQVMGMRSDIANWQTRIKAYMVTSEARAAILEEEELEADAEL